MSGVLSSGVSKPGTGDIEGVTAGVGIAGGGSSGTVTVTLDLSELSAVTPTNGDSLSTIDSDGSTEQLTTIAALATLLAGAGLTASSSVIGADDSTASAKGIVIVAGGDGISVSYSSGTATSAVDLGTNSGLEISSNKLQIAKGISQHDVAQFTSNVADDDFLRVDGTVVEGRSASEVLSDISAAPAAGSANIVTTGALDSGSITSGFGNIDTGSSTIATTGAVSTGTIAASDDVTIAADKSLNLSQGAKITFTDQILDNSIDDHDAQGIIFTFRAGATVTPFSPVYVDGNNEVQECDADAIATMPCIGVSVNTSNVSADADCPVLMLGLVRDDSFTDFGAAGAPVYVSTTVGTMTTTAPSGTDDVVQVIGHSIAEDLIFVQPCLTTIEHA